MHVLILSHFKEIECTIHAHPFYCMPFVAQAKPIPNVTEATMAEAEVGCIPWAKAYSEELSRSVYQYFEDHREIAEKKPIGMIMPSTALWFRPQYLSGLQHAGANRDRCLLHHHQESDLRK